MPSDLDEFLSSMLSRLDDFYFEQAYKLFKVAMTSEDRFSLLTYSCILEGEDFDPVSTEVKSIPKSQSLERCEAMELRLYGRCRGLLEVSASRSDVYIGGHVDFLHRTVRDFFQLGALDKMLREIKRRESTTESLMRTRP